jgi:hypothetical protein
LSSALDVFPWYASKWKFIHATTQWRHWLLVSAQTLKITRLHWNDVAARTDERAAVAEQLDGRVWCGGLVFQLGVGVVLSYERGGNALL